MKLMCLRGSRERSRALNVLAELHKILRTIEIKMGLADKHLEPTRKDGEEGRGERSLHGVRRATGEASSDQIVPYGEWTARAGEGWRA